MHTILRHICLSYTLLLSIHASLHAMYSNHVGTVKYVHTATEPRYFMCLPDTHPHNQNIDDGIKTIQSYGVDAEIAYIYLKYEIHHKWLKNMYSNETRNNLFKHLEQTKSNAHNFITEPKQTAIDTAVSHMKKLRVPNELRKAKIREDLQHLYANQQCSQETVNQLWHYGQKSF